MKVKKAQAWNENEVVSYWECPYCEHLNTSGSDIVWDSDCEDECASCKMRVTVLQPEDES